MKAKVLFLFFKIDGKIKSALILRLVYNFGLDFPSHFENGDKIYNKNDHKNSFIILIYG